MGYRRVTPVGEGHPRGCWHAVSVRFCGMQERLSAGSTLFSRALGKRYISTVVVGMFLLSADDVCVCGRRPINGRVPWTCICFLAALVVSSRVLSHLPSGETRLYPPRRVFFCLPGVVLELRRVLRHFSLLSPGVLKRRNRDKRCMFTSAVHLSSCRVWCILREGQHYTRLLDDSC